MPPRKKNKYIEIRAEATLDFDSRTLRLNTKVDPLEMGYGLHKLSSEVTRQVFVLQEEVIKEALMALGWTPPETSDDVPAGVMERIVELGRVIDEANVPPNRRYVVPGMPVTGATMFMNEVGTMTRSDYDQAMHLVTDQPDPDHIVERTTTMRRDAADRETMHMEAQDAEDAARRRGTEAAAQQMREMELDAFGNPIHPTFSVDTHQEPE
jgi:hypothetical protein